MDKALAGVKILDMSRVQAGRRALNCWHFSELM